MFFFRKVPHKLFGAPLLQYVVACAYLIVTTGIEEPREPD